MYSPNQKNDIGLRLASQTIATAIMAQCSLYSIKLNEPCRTTTLSTPEMASRFRQYSASKIWAISSSVVPESSSRVVPNRLVLSVNRFHLWGLWVAFRHCYFTTNASICIILMLFTFFGHFMSLFSTAPQSLCILRLSAIEVMFVMLFLWFQAIQKQWLKRKSLGSQVK